MPTRRIVVSSTLLPLSQRLSWLVATASSTTLSLVGLSRRLVEICSSHTGHITATAIPSHESHIVCLDLPRCHHLQSSFKCCFPSTPPCGQVPTRCARQPSSQSHLTRRSRQRFLRMAPPAAERARDLAPHLSQFFNHIGNFGMSLRHRPDPVSIA